MIWEAQRRARAGLAAAISHADAQLCGLVARHGAEQVWHSLIQSQRSGLARRAQAVNLEQIIAQTEAVGSRFIIPGDDEWPTCLDELDTLTPVGSMGGAPYGIWVTGEGDLSEYLTHSVALVGSRACSDYGSMVVTDLAYELASAGWTIISGGAYGIDIAAHKAALAANGRTIAVLANGVDVHYPRGNSAALAQIGQRGLVVSELPPGTHPTKPGFLARNRLIAALAQATVIIEASDRSGARNTATWAGELGRMLMAVPGSIYSAGSVTPHRLIRDAEATLVSSAADVIGLLTPVSHVLPVASHSEGDVQGGLLDHLNSTELAVRESLPGRGTRSAGEVSLVTGFDMATCVGALGSLQHQGLVAMTEEGRWKLSRGEVGQR